MPPNSRLAFFTPAVLRRMQSARFTSDEWRSILRDYQAHIVSLSPVLARSVQSLARIAFHDCVLERFEFVAPARVILTLRGSKWFKSHRPNIRGVHQLVFGGVEQTDLGLKHLSSRWKYEELHLSDGLPDLRVALNSGQFHLRFRTFKMRTDKT